MASKLEESRAKTLMRDVMDRVNGIGHLVENKNFKKAHDKRDELFAFVMQRLVNDIDNYTKRDIEEFMRVCLAVDDWGV